MISIDGPSDGLKIKYNREKSTSLVMDQSFIVSSTVNTRIKEYASFMFKTFEGANQRGM